MTPTMLACLEFHVQAARQGRVRALIARIVERVLRGAR